MTDLVCSLQGQDDNKTLNIQRPHFGIREPQDTCEPGFFRGLSLRLIILYICPSKAYLSCRRCLHFKGKTGAKSAALVCTSAFGNTPLSPFDGVPSRECSFRVLGSCFDIVSISVGVRSDERQRTTGIGQGVEKRSFRSPEDQLRRMAETKGPLPSSADTTSYCATSRR